MTNIETSTVVRGEFLAYGTLHAPNHTAPLNQNRQDLRIEQSRLGKKAVQAALEHFAWKNQWEEATVYEYTYSHSQSGRPMLTHKNDTARCVTVSVAHTQRIAIASIADQIKEGFIGVDIEYVRAFDKKMIERFCTPKELSTLQQCDSKGPTLLWCLKEAYLKAIGTGLTVDPRRVEFQNFYNPQKITVCHDGFVVQASVSWTFYRNQCILSRVIVQPHGVPIFVI